MGELFIQKPTGESITIQQDGSEIRENLPLQIDWCDKCEMWKPLSGGQMVANRGLTLIWLCEACK
jgi:hypothetical protein